MHRARFEAESAHDRLTSIEHQMPAHSGLPTAAPGKRRGVVVITGASAGIGRAAAREFAAHGYDVGLIARGEDGLRAARDEIHAAGCRAVTQTADVADASQVEAAAAAIERELGPIDVWVNNAMVSILAPFPDISVDEFQRVTEVTYLGVVWGTKAALARMRPRGAGRIVQVGSALAYRAIPLQSAYCGAKHAIRGFTESVRCELLHERSRVRISIVELPGVNTPQFDWIRNRMPRKSRPIGRVFQPEVAARAIVWAAHHDRRELYVGGPTVQSVIGDKLAPGLLDRYMAATVYEGHQRPEPEDPDRPDNLWSPLPGDHGAHGSFDDCATPHSLQLWATTHRAWLALAGVLVLAAALTKKT